MSNTEQCWAMLSSGGHRRAVLSNAEQCWECWTILSSSEQCWTMLNNAKQKWTLSSKIVHSASDSATLPAWARCNFGHSVSNSHTHAPSPTTLGYSVNSFLFCLQPSLSHWLTASFIALLLYKNVCTYGTFKHEIYGARFLSAAANLRRPANHNF